MFGGSVCAGADLLPPAGDGWRSLAAVRDGNAQPLGRPLARGSLGYIQLLFSLPLTVPRGSWRNGPMRASSPTNARAARSEAERAEREAGQMRPCTPTRSEPPPRDGSADFAEENSVPEGQPKSEQAPIRRPPSRAEGHCTGARQAPFSFGPCTARFLFGQDRKENGGCIPLDKPPGGSQPPVAAVRRPLPLPADQLIQRQVVEVRQGDQRGQSWLPRTTFVIPISAFRDANGNCYICLLEAPFFA